MTEQEQYRQQIADDFKQIMAAPHGRRFVSELLDHCRLYQASYGPDERSTCFNEGRRNVGLKILADINDICPELYAVMVNERNELISRLNEKAQEDENDG